MTTKQIRQSILICLLAITVTVSLGKFSSAQSGAAKAGERGLGYSEAPFELIENAQAEANGTTAIEAVQAASASPEPIELDRIVVEGDYALLSVEYNYIGVSAIAKKQGTGWQFVCRAGGLMAPQELTERCEVPATTAESLYAAFLGSR